MTPVLETQRLRLRPFQIADAAQLQAILSEREIAYNVLSVPHPFEADDATHYLQKRLTSDENNLVWAMTSLTDDILMGCVRIWITPKHHRAGLGYWLGKPHWGQGLTTEAVRCVLQYAFTNLDLNRIFAECFPENPASARVLEKCGLRYEGTLRQVVYTRFGEFRDLQQFAILRDEFLANA